MKKLALISIAVIGAATMLLAQDKKQTTSSATNNGSATKPIGPSDASKINNPVESVPENATFIGIGTLVEQEPKAIQKTEELNAAPVKAAPRKQESKPVAR